MKPVYDDDTEKNSRHIRRTNNVHKNFKSSTYHRHKFGSGKGADITFGKKGVI